MARPITYEREQTAAALIELRRRLKDTQQQFASRLGTSITTIARYETVRPPIGAALMKLADIAMAAGYKDLAKIFKGGRTHCPTCGRKF